MRDTIGRQEAINELVRWSYRMDASADTIPGRGTGMTEELKRCPFCGGEAAIVYQARRKVYKSDKYVYGNCVYCTNCDAEIFSSINKATEMWNRREGGQDETD